MVNFFSLLQLATGRRPTRATHLGPACGWLACSLLLALLPSLALAQIPVVTVTPAGPLALCAGSSQTLTATAILPGFNVGGTGFDGEVRAVVVQPDGKVLVGGSFTTYNGNAAAPDNLLRLNTDGSRDASFNPGGTGVDGWVYALAVQPDGKVLVGGSFTNYNGSAAPDGLLRLNTDGSLDTGFNGGGIGIQNVVYAVAVQPDGKVLVGGNFVTYNGAPGAPDNLLRLTTAGSLDPSFNSGNDGPNGEVYALVVQPDGKALLGGHFTTYNGRRQFSKHVLRLNTDGSADVYFNYEGGADNDVLALALKPGGQVVIGGMFSAFNEVAAPYGVLLLDAASARRDFNFNNGGSGTNSSVTALALQADGKVLVGGPFTAYNGRAAKRLLRLNTDGSLDADFNGGNAGPDSYVNALAVQPDGKVLVGGSFTTYNGNAAAPDNLLRLNADGSLNDAPEAGTDLSVTWNNGATGASITVNQPGDYQATATTGAGSGYSNVVRLSAPPVANVTVTPAGPLLLPAGGSALLSATATVPGYNVGGTGFDGPVYAVLPQPDGKVLVGGDFRGINGLLYVSPDKVLRLNADGTLDQSFNGGGPVGAGPTGTAVLALALQPDGKVLVGGSFNRYNNVAASNLIRLNANGSLDTSFHPSGVPNGIVQALAVQPNGQVLVGGNFPGNVLRLNADGSRDPAFNPGGTGPNNPVSALVLQPDGKVLIGGSFTTYNNGAAPGRVLRLTVDGALDATFNAGRDGANSGVRALALQPDGKVLVGGNFTGYNGITAVPDYVLRLNADGLRDTEFNISGTGLAGTFVGALAVQADGKVLVGGSFTDYNGNAAPDNVLRLNANGSLDTGFNNAGSGASGLVYALAPLPSGQVLAGGIFGDYNGSNAPDNLLRLNGNGNLNDANVTLAGATFTFNPGNTTGSTRTVTTPGSYTATFTDPATGCGIVSNAVVVTVTTPYLTSLTPDSGVGGTAFDIVGTNLGGVTDIRVSSNSNGTSVSLLYNAKGVSVTDSRITGLRMQYSAPGTYTVTVITPVGVSNGLSFTVPNRPPTGLTLSNTTVDENAGANAIVGTFTTIDPDGGDPHRYTLVAGPGSDDNGSFNISFSLKLSADVLLLKASANYKTKSSYAIRVRTTDGGKQSFEQTFTITVRPTTAPTLTSLTAGTTTGGTPVFAGTAPAGSTVTLYLTAPSGGAAQVLGITTAKDDGSFSFTAPTALPSGSYAVYATVQVSGENVGTPSATIPFTVDATPPTLVSSVRQSPATELTNAASLSFRVSFSEAVMGVTPSAFTLTSTGTATGTVATLTAVSASVYDVTVSGATGTGSLRLDVPSLAPGLTDLAGNALAGSYASGQAYTLDNTPPTATINSASGPNTSLAPIPFTVSFSETVTGFAASSLSVTNGTLAGGLTPAGNSYTFSVTPTADGPVTVSVAAGAAQDAVGNPNPAAGPLSVTYQAPPTLTRLSPPSGPAGTLVTLTGTNLGGTTAVSFNGTVATTFTAVNATTLTATVPVGATTGLVTVTTPGGAASAAQAFTVTPPVALALVSANPARNALAAAPATPVALTYNQAVEAATTGGVRVFSHQAGGRQTLTVGTSGNTLTLTPVTPFRAGETVLVTSPASVRGTFSGSLAGAPTVYQFTTGVVRSSGTFSGGTNPSVGSVPVSVTAADIDGDGDLDLLTANGLAGTVSIRRNNGLGVYSGTSSVAVGIGPTSVVTADVDGDGDLDLLVANTGSHNVSVRFNNGLGVFSGTGSVAVGYGPVAATAADIDGDGDLDLLVANLASSTVSLRLNNGLGIFSGTGSLAVGPNTSSLEAADVDGDGDLDLLIANAGSQGTVSVRLNNGQGIFTSSQTVAVGAYPTHVVAADVDADGDLDMLTADSYTNTVSVRFNNGRGTFAGTSSVSVGYRPLSVEAADVDGDGDLDLLVANGASNTVSVRLNNGLGIFSGTQSVTVGSVPSRVAAADVDGDGDLDLLVANAGSNTVSVRLNQNLSAAARSSQAQRVVETELQSPTLQLQAFPNPFRTSVRFEFVLGHTDAYSLAVYDVLGRVVASLSHGSAVAGEWRQAEWVAEQAPAGVYLVRLTTAAGTQQVKVVKE